MKRKFLIILLSLVCIFCWSLFVVACKDNDDTSDDSTDSTVGVMTEAQWKNAIADSLAATNYTVVATENRKSQFGEIYDELTGKPISITHEHKYDYIVKYDGVNGVVYYYRVYTFLEYYRDTLQDFHESVDEEYLEFFGSDIIGYYKSDIDEVWSKYTRSFSTKDEVEATIMELGIISSLFGANYKVPGTDDAKTIDELFNQFIYDENTNTYSADVVMVFGNSESPEMKLTLDFANGKLYSYEFEYATAEDSPWVKFVYSDYNSTTVSIPEEVKAAH